MQKSEKFIENSFRFKFIQNVLPRSHPEYQENMILLVKVKSLITKQLTKMGKQYITKLVLDREHISGVLSKGNQVYGACVFRQFPENKFCELVFLAVDTKHQLKGRGSYIVQNLKEQLCNRNIFQILTYADNQALRFFYKQGFTPYREQNFLTDYMIKHYNNGTLMSCLLHRQVDFHCEKDIIAKQIDCILDLIKTACPPKIYQITSQEAKQKEIPGIHQSGHSIESKQRLRKQFEDSSREKAEKIIEDLKAEPLMKQFMKPIDKNSDYCKKTKEEPMWLSKIEQNLQKGVYDGSLPLFKKHVQDIFKNAITYHRPGTFFFAMAWKMQRKLPALLEISPQDLDI